MSIPKEIKLVIDELKKAGFEAYIVGGCVRDFLRGVEPTDWDVTTNAKPKDVEKIFPKTYFDNKFGTVRVLFDSKKERLKEIEVTSFRIESKYTDKRHPDEIKFAKTIDQDLKRRDFTVNAMAMDINIKPQISIPKSQSNHKSQAPNSKLTKFQIVDLFEGQKDLKNKIIRAVGNAEQRFDEDALRMMRAVRFVSVLGKDWKIEKKTGEAIKKNAPWLQAISKERIRDEFLKIIMSDKAYEGVEALREFGLLRYIAPEIEQCYGVSQNKHHIYGVYEHCLLSLKYAAKKSFNKYVRLAALFHDIAKPLVKDGKGEDATFYNHEVVGARVTAQILNRLKFAKKDIEKIVKLVRYHLFYYNVDEVGEASVRRLVRQVGPENTDELLEVRMCDRIGSGCPKAEPYKLRHLRYLIEKVAQDPISVRKLKVNGDDIMKILNVKPGPKIGQILDILFGYVLLDPKKNKKDFLEKQVKKLGKSTILEIQKLSKKAKEEQQKLTIKRDEMTKKKYWVT